MTRSHVRSRTRFATVLVAAALLFAACGDDDGAADNQTSDGSGAAGAACLAGAEDCDDMGAPGADELPIDDSGDDADQPGTGMAMCAPDEPDCQDMVVADSGSADSGDLPDDETAADEDYRARAQALLGTPEDELGDDIRVGRRGDESYAVTDDYVVGRMTVELDDDGTGTFVVTAVTVELNTGSETITS